MKLMVIDGNSILNRAFYGVRPLSTRDGTPHQRRLWLSHHPPEAGGGGGARRPVRLFRSEGAHLPPFGL